VLSYFMMDDSLLIFEPPIRNSGIVGGKFLERQRVYKPGSEEIYTHQVCKRMVHGQGGQAGSGHCAFVARLCALEPVAVALDIVA
jgi:hypothetical protein